MPKDSLFSIQFNWWPPDSKNGDGEKEKKNNGDIFFDDYDADTFDSRDDGEGGREDNDW